MLQKNTIRGSEYWIAAFILGSCLLLTHHLNAQFQLPQGATFYDMVDSLTLHLPSDTSEGGIKNRLRRDGMTWGTRLAPDGRMSRATTAITTYSRDFNQSLGRSSAVHSWNPNWLELGPTTAPTGSSSGKGMGQIHRLAFHPNFNGTTNQIMYAGSHYGGLYRSDDGGQHWQNYHTDRGLPMTSVSGIGVSAQRVFVCTGNGDHGYADYGAAAFYSPLGPGRMNDANPLHTQGVYMLSNGSTAWQGINGTTSLIDGSSPGDLLRVFLYGGTMRDLQVHPTNDNILFIATSKGIFRTTNQGQSWQQVLVGAANGMGGYWEDAQWRSVQFHPTNPNIVYASGSQIYESTNGGTTWQPLTGPASSGASLDFNNNNYSYNGRPLVVPRRIGLAVSPAAPNLLYAYLVTNHFSSVVTYNRQTNTWQVWYNSPYGNGQQLMDPSWCGIDVSPLDGNMVAFGHTVVRGTRQGAGGFQNWSSYGGANFHADVHAVAFPPNSDNVLYAATHGGVSVKDMDSTLSINAGWTALYNGLGVATIWSFDDWEGNDSLMAAANQDVGVNYSDSRGHFWRNNLNIGDGYGIGIDDQTGAAYIKGNYYEGVFRLTPSIPRIQEYNISNYFAYFGANPPEYQGSGVVSSLIPNTFPLVNHPKTDSVYIGASELYKRDQLFIQDGYWVQEITIDTLNDYKRMGSLDTLGNFIPGGHYSSPNYWYNIDTIPTTHPNAFYPYRVFGYYCPHPPTNGLCIDTTIQLVGNLSNNQVAFRLWQQKSNLKTYFNSRWNRRILSIAFSEDENTDYTYLATLGDPVHALRRCDFYFRDAAQHCDTCFIRKTANVPIDTNNIRTDPNPITGIALDPLNGNRLWMSFSGYNQKIKVWYSDDAGDSWTNYDDDQNTLAKLNVPINDIVYQRGTRDRLYIATDVGVYVREIGGDWLRYGHDFPNVRTTELKINYCVGKLRVATFGRGAWEADLLPAEDNIAFQSFRIIQGTERWESNKNMSRSIKIPAGATLILNNMTLNMPAQSLIIVEQGGTLQVNGSTITNLCGQTWQGIEVWGNGQQPQHPTNNQGFVTLTDSRVEYAKNALRNWQVNHFPNAGGILQASNTVFYNNWRSIEMLLHWTGQNERSFLNGCTFEVDNDYRGFDSDTTGLFLGHISMWGISNMSIRGCSFKDLRTDKQGDQSQGGSYGIFGYSSSPRLTSLPLGGTWPPQSYQRNRFEGLERGIELSGAPIWGQVIVDQTDFVGTEQAIILRTTDGARILRDSFFVGNFQTQGGTSGNQGGIVKDFALGLSSCTGYGVEQNYFTQSAGAGSSTSTVGSWVEASGTSYNEIRNNGYEGVTGGNLAHGRNQNFPASEIGLQYLCNENTANEHDFFVLANGSTNNADASIALHQGTNSQANRNTLSSSTQPFPSQSHVSNYSYTQGVLNQPVIYYYANSGNQVPDPALLFNTNRQQSFLGPVDYCKDDYQAFFTTNKHSGHTIVYLKGQYDQSSSNYTQTKETYENTPQTDTTARRNTQSQLGYWAGQKAYWLNAVVDYYLADSSVQVDSVALWLSKQDDLSGQYRLVDFYWSLGLYNQSIELLQELPSRFVMGELQQQDYDQYLLLKDLLRRAFDQDQTLRTLDYAVVETLEEIAQIKSGRASQQAKGILRFFYGKENADYPYLEFGGSARFWQDENSQPKAANIRATPNPALNWTEISYVLPEGVKEATLLIISTTGKEIESVNITLDGKVSQGMRIFDTNTWAGGTYFIVLRSGNETIASSQLIIQR